MKKEKVLKIREQKKRFDWDSIPNMFLILLLSSIVGLLTTVPIMTYDALTNGAGEPESTLIPIQILTNVVVTFIIILAYAMSSSGTFFRKEVTVHKTVTVIEEGQTKRKKR